MLVCPHSGIGNQIGNYVFAQFLIYKGADVKFLFSKDENIDRTFVLDKFNTELTKPQKEDIKKFLKAGVPFLNYGCLIKNIYLRKKEYFNSFYKVLQRVRLEYGIYPLKTPALMAKVVSYRDVLEKTASDKDFLDSIAVCDCYSPIKEFYEPSFREEMKKHFVLKEEPDEKNNEILKKIKGCKNSVGIHIRRGDYIGLKIPVVKKEFLLEKISFLDKKFNNTIDSNKCKKQDNAQFFIFSDSIEWAKENIQGENICYVDINDETKGYLDFVLLNNCRHRIYSASSFSKWIQYLNPFNDSVEFMPEGKDLIVE